MTWSRLKCLLGFHDFRPTDNYPAPHLRWWKCARCAADGLERLA